MDKKIFRLALPNIVSNLSVPLLGAVDAVLMGHLPDAKSYLAAIAIATGIFNFVYWGFGFLRMGTTGMTAQAHGADDHRESNRTLGRGLLVALAGGALILLLQYPIDLLGFWFMEGSDEAMEIARGYYYIRIWAAPATLGLYVLHGWFLGMQNAIYPMFLSIAVNLANIGLNLLFVFGFGMKAEGIALATLIAQYLGLAIALGLFYWKYGGQFRKYWPDKLLQAAALKRFFLVNFDIIIRTLCLVFVFNYFIARSGAMGDEILAANALLMQLLFIMSYIVDGFAFAAESLVGRFKGAGDWEGMRLAIRRIFVWGMGFGLLFCLMYAVAGKPLLQLFTDDPDVVPTALIYLPWMIAMPLWGTYSFMWDGIYIGATASAPMRNSMLISTFVIFLPALWISEPYLHNHGLWLAMSLFMLFRGLTLALFAKKSGLK